MDTTFWGPDGWILLHTITYFLPEKLNSKEQKLVRLFYENVSKILPCKYCRNSNQKYMKSLPIEKYSSTRVNMNMWIYLLHNKVNNKLRRQGYCIYDNPKFEEIDSRYQNMRIQIVNERSKCIEILICNKYSLYKKYSKTRLLHSKTYYTTIVLKFVWDVHKRKR